MITTTSTTTPALSIESYMPAPALVPTANILATRATLQAYLAGWYPDLDTRPGSVAGDLMITPLAVVMAASDIAIGSLLADMDLSNLAAGNVTNQDFAQAYLQAFGAIQNSMVASTGVVQMTFTTNKAYAFSAASQLLFGGLVFGFNVNEGDPIIVYPTGMTNQKRVLTKINDGQYVVYFPVYGINGASVSDGDAATTNIIIPELTSVTAMGDFDPGQTPDNIASMAAKASTTFYSATLTTRSGANAFLSRQFPSLLGTSVVTTGDAEMIRDAQNPLGIHTGEVDVFAKSQTVYATGQQVVTLTYNNRLQGWCGLLNLPVTPAFFNLSGSVFSVDSFGNKQSSNTLYSTSNDVNYDNIGISFSAKESLGLLIDKSNAPQSIQNQAVATGPNPPGSTGQLVVDGTYNGYLFDGQSVRSAQIIFTSASTVTVSGQTYATLSALAVDQVLGISMPMTFVANSSVSPTLGVAQADYNYSKFFDGLTISITASGTFVPANFVGQTYNFSYGGRTGDFLVTYQYDPSLVAVEAAIADTDNTPIGVDLLTRSFMPCYVTKMVINYRAPFGASVDTASAQSAITSYLNSIVYPNVYQDSAISQLMLAYGATGVTSIQKQGVCYPSLGQYFVDQSGTQTLVPRLLTTDLAVPANSWGIGPRNINYIAQASNITFNPTSY